MSTFWGPLQCLIRSDTEQAQVKKLANSIYTVGQLNPIQIDQNNNLLAGSHRIHALQHLGATHVKAIRLQVNDLQGKLIEIAENLDRNDLTALEKAEHIAQKEQVLKELGLRAKQGDNRFSNRGVLQDTSTLAGELNLNKRQYQRYNQVGNLSPKIRELLRDSSIRNNLKEMATLSRLSEGKHIKKLLNLKSEKPKNVKKVDDFFFELSKEERVFPNMIHESLLNGDESCMIKVQSTTNGFRISKI